MQIEINVSEKTLRKIKALNILLGTTAGTFEEQFSHFIEKAINDAIIQACEAPMDLAGRFPRAGAAVDRTDRFHDATGISDGLGDADEDPQPPPPAKEATAMVPKKGGLTDQVLEADMAVEDPEHEAKVDADTFGAELKGKPAETAFGEVFGAAVPEVDPRIARRKKTAKSRAKISPFMEGQPVEDRI